MNTYTRQIGQGDYIKHWAFDTFQMAPYTCEKEKDDVDFETLKNYHTMEDVGKIKYAVRRAYTGEIAERMKKVDLPKIEMKKLYYHIESDAVELSTFFHQPTILSGAAKTFIESTYEGVYHFTLKCSCYLKMWVNGQEVGTYDPKTRNVEATYALTVPLKVGTNEVTIYIEDLAERDIFFYFELRYEDEAKLTYFVPIDGDQEAIEGYAKVLKSLHTTAYSLEKGAIKVYYDQGLVQEPMTLYRSYTSYGLNDALNKDETFCLTPDKDYFEMRIDEEGEYFCLFTAYSGNVELKLYLFINIYDRANLELTPAKTLEERKGQAISFLAQHPYDTVSSAIAQMVYHGKMTKDVEDLLWALLQRVEEKEDCADFVFLPVLMLYAKYPELLSEALKVRIKTLALGFRYWFDEPGNDVMWFYSENHALLFHGCQYLAGYLFEKECFEVSGLRGYEQKAIGEAKLTKWLDDFLKQGYDEWNSVTYLPIDFIGLFSLYIAAPDEAMRQKVTQALDATFEVIAANIYKHKYTAAYARVYESNIKGAESSETNFFAWIAFGQGMLTKQTKSVGFFAISNYIPPKVDHILKGTYKRPVTVERKEGCFGAHTYVHKTDDYALSTAINFKPFTPGMQQHVLNIALGEAATVIAINHPGEKAFSGERRPSYWAGNGTLPYVYQHKNAALAIFRIEPTHTVDFIHAVVPFSNIDAYKMCNNWLFIQKDEGLVAIWWSNGYSRTMTGANTNKEVIAYGRDHGLYIKCASLKEYPSFEAFQAMMLQTEIVYDGAYSLSVEDPRGSTLAIDCTAYCLIDGKRLPVTPAERLVIRHDASNK